MRKRIKIKVADSYNFGIVALLFKRRLIYIRISRVNMRFCFKSALFYYKKFLNYSSFEAREYVVCLQIYRYVGIS